MASTWTGRRGIREAVGVFHDAESLQAAIDALLSSGFDHADLSLLAGHHAVEDKLGHAFRRVEELEDEARVPRIGYISTEALGDAEGSLIGGLMYVGAIAAAGAVIIRSMPPCSVLGGIPAKVLKSRTGD